jgi:hypothetical protein
LVKSVQAAALAAQAKAKQDGHDGDPAAISADINDPTVNRSAVAWHQSVVGQLSKVRSTLAFDQGKGTVARYHYPPLAALVADPNLGLQNPAGLWANLNVQKYGGSCPPGSKAFDQLQNAATTSGGSLDGNCTPTAPPPTTPATTSAVTPSTVDTSNSQTTGRTTGNVSDLNTTTKIPQSLNGNGGGNGNGSGSGAGSDKASGGGFFSGIGSFFSSLPMNQMMAGAAFGGAIGMLFGFGSPVGVIGGALIGGLLGAIVGSGLIGKMFGSGGTGGS